MKWLYIKLINNKPTSFFISVIKSIMGLDRTIIIHKFIVYFYKSNGGEICQKNSYFFTFYVL